MNTQNLLRRSGALALALLAVQGALAEIKFPASAQRTRAGLESSAARGLETARPASTPRSDGVEGLLRSGLDYYQNAGVPMAPALARQRWKQAAETGDARAMVAYGWLLANGIGGLRDVEQAREWITEARVAGLARATFVASLLEGRISGAKKRVESMQLLEQAARDGDPLATNNLGVALELEGNLTGARGLYEAAALQGNATARENLERLHRLARPVDGINLSRLRLQADDGDTDAMLQLAQRYHRGEGVPQDYAQAILYYRRAADGGSVRAREFIALIFSRAPRDKSQLYDPAWMRELAARINLQSDRRPGGAGVAQNDRPRRNEDPMDGLLDLRPSARAVRWTAQGSAFPSTGIPVAPAQRPTPLGLESDAGSDEPLEQAGLEANSDDGPAVASPADGTGLPRAQTVP